MEQTPLEYPQFFRSGNRCVKRTDDTTTIEIVVPIERKALPLTHGPATYPSKERLDQEVAGMEATDQYTYEEYVIAFFQAAARNREVITEIRQLRYNRQQAELKQKQTLTNQ